MIPFSKQYIDKSDLKTVEKVLKSDFLTQGPFPKKFENKLSEFVGAKFVISCNNGTSALHLACMALGIKFKDIVWTVPITFAASANCALNCGASVDFVDIDPKTFNMSVEDLEAKLIQAKKQKKLPKVVIPVHLGGLPTEQKKIWQLSKKYNFKIIEDASHSLGAKHYGEPVGSCKWSHITTFSFHPVKMITTIEGGAALTNNKQLAQKMTLFKSNGIEKDKNNFLNKKMKNSPWYYEHKDLGYNYRMNDISAALGINQLSKIEKFINERNRIANIYKKNLKNYPIKFQKVESYNLSSYHLVIIQIDLKKTKFTYQNIFKRLRNKNIYTNLHYMPLHLSHFFSKNKRKNKKFPTSENYGKSSLSIPVYYGLSDKELFKVCRELKNFF